MAPTGKNVQKDTEPMDAIVKEELEDDEIGRLQNNISQISGKIAAAFLAEKNRNSTNRTNPSSTFGNILSQLTKFVTISPSDPDADQQLVQNTKILEALQSKYMSLLQNDHGPISMHQKRVMTEVANKIAGWVESISTEADRNLRENRTVKGIVEEAANEVKAEIDVTKSPELSEKQERRKSILRSNEVIIPMGPKQLCVTTTTTINSDSSVTSIGDVYEWANWMVDAMATAEDWRTWIQKTVEETKSMQEDMKPGPPADWKAWKKHVAEEAVKLIKRKRGIQETAPTWAKNCCDTMVATDFVLNKLAGRESVTSGLQLETSADDVRDDKEVKPYKPTLAEQRASAKRLSGSPTPKGVPSKHNLVTATKSTVPEALRPLSRQRLSAKRRPSPVVTSDETQGLPEADSPPVLSAPKRTTVAIASGSIRTPAVISSAYKRSSSYHRSPSPISSDERLPNPSPHDRHSAATILETPISSIYKRASTPISSSPKIVPSQISTITKRASTPIASPQKRCPPPISTAKKHLSPTTTKQLVKSSEPKAVASQNPSSSNTAASSLKSASPKPTARKLVEGSPVSKLSIRQRDGSIYTTDANRKNITCKLHPTPLPKMASMVTSPSPSCKLHSPSKVRRPRSPYSVPDAPKGKGKGGQNCPPVRGVQHGYALVAGGPSSQKMKQGYGMPAMPPSQRMQHSYGTQGGKLPQRMQQGYPVAGGPMTGKRNLPPKDVASKTMKGNQWGRETNGKGNYSRSSSTASHNVASSRVPFRNRPY